MVEQVIGMTEELSLIRKMLKMEDIFGVDSLAEITWGQAEFLTRAYESYKRHGRSLDNGDWTSKFPNSYDKYNYSTKYSRKMDHNYNPEDIFHRGGYELAKYRFNSINGD